MSNQGSVSLEYLSAKLAKLSKDRREVPESVVQLVIAFSFISVWTITFFTQGESNWKAMLMGLIPTFLTFNSRKRSTILLVGLASMVATALNIWVVNAATYRGDLGINFAIKFFVTLSISICYFANRQRNMILDEQRKRARRDFELRELERAYAALKKSQIALKRMTSMLAENAPVAIAQLTPSLHYAMVNPMYLNLMVQLTGTHDLELIGTHIADFKALGMEPIEWEETATRLQQGIRVNLPNQVLVAKTTGSVSYYDWTIWPMKDESGTIDSILLLGTDVTERTRAEMKLAAALTDLEKSNQAKDTFLATLSHELRTPLTPILGWAKIIQSLPIDVDLAHQGLQSIERNAKLQSQLVDDLLDLSRITMGKVELSYANVDLNEIVQRALETVQSRTGSNDWKLELLLSSERLSVHGDATRLVQVVWNLLSNAMKFTPVGGAIKIKTSLVGSKCEIEVADSGPGIPSDILPTLFEPFKQGDSSITRKYGGLGIGLSIVRSLVEMHQGTIHVHSNGQGEGAVFTVRLPFVSAPSENIGQGEPAIAHPHLTGTKVLVLEDSQDTRALLNVILQAGGCLVETADTVKEALDKTRIFHPEVIVSDIGLPGEDGYEFARRLRVMPGLAQIPIIALTGFAMESDRQKAFESGFDRHIAKPVDPALLLETIRELKDLGSVRV